MSFLKSIVDIGGVQGAAVFSGAGECVAFELPAPYEAILLQTVMQEFRAALEFFEYLDDAPFQQLCLQTGGATIIVRQAGEFTVFVLADQDVNVATAGVGMNVVCLKLQKEGLRAGPDASGSISQHSTGSLARSFGSADFGPPPSDAVGIDTIRGVIALLVAELGPFAKTLVKQQLKKMGTSPKTIGRAQYDDLVSVVATKIPDEDKRQTFMKKAHSLSR